jgi:glyceraldehyde-3-phosphate dehydrogenase type I
MKVRVAINGFGRIGRCVCRSLFENDYYNQQIELVAVNELADLATMVHLIKYDSTFGRFKQAIESEGNDMIVNGRRIRVLHEKSAGNLPWDELGIDVVLECTGSFTCREKAEEHIKSGAKKLIFSQPADNDIDATVIYGINHHVLQPGHTIISNASCTSNCIIPIIHILDKHFTVEAGTVTTIHSAMLDQPILDSYNKDLRKTRSAMQSIIPVKTELHKGIDKILPHLAGKFETLAIRVPTTDVSLMDAAIAVQEETSIEDVNRLIVKYSANSMKGVLGATSEELVSCDFIGDSRSSIVDLSQTRVAGKKLVKVLTWFDNEWGYSNRMLDTTLVATGRKE